MKRILPFLLAVPVAAYAFACSSSDDATNNPASNNGANDGGNASTGDGGDVTTPVVDPAEANINPTEAVTVSSFAQIEAAAHGMTWIPTEKAFYVAEPTTRDPFDGTPTRTIGKIIRVNADGTFSGVLAGTGTESTTDPPGPVAGGTGELFGVAYNATSKKVIVVGTNQLLTVEPTGTALQTGTVYSTQYSGLASDDAGTNVPFVGLNDIVLKKDGTGYVTEPYYPFDSPDFVSQRVYYVKADGSAASVAHYENHERPNGVALSPDEKTLYVVLTNPTVDVPGHGLPVYGTIPAIWKYTVNTDGSLSAGAKFALVGTTKSADQLTKPDGIAVDRSGNVYVATVQGVVVYKPSGDVWGTIVTPEQVASVAFGGDDLKTLYIGSSNDPMGDGNAKNTGTIYKATLKVTGIAR